MLASRLWFAAHRAIDLDEYEHAHAAWSVAQGQVPYVDFFEHHTPALYFAAAPLFAAERVETDPDAAIRALMAARIVMWLLTVAIVALTYRVGAEWRNGETGAFAALLLATSPQFLESMLEFRPDVGAVCALMLALVAGAGFAGGIAFGVALMFTQKALFAAPGFLVAILLAPNRFRRAVTCGAGVLVPIAVTMTWFAAHHALGALYFYNVTVNARLNVDRFSPIPRLVANMVQQPAIYLLGAAGLVAALRRAAIDRDRLLWPATAAALAVGIFAIGKAYDQYYAMLLPLLAVLGAAFAQSKGFLERRAPTAVAIVAVVALCAANLHRTYRSNATQVAALRWVTTHTAPTDSYLGGSPGAALFRPHAWFYFFLTGPFATDADYATLAAALESGRVSPRIVIDDRYLALAPPSVTAFVERHYRRQKEYGSEGLKIREASDRFDRPLIK